MTDTLQPIIPGKVPEADLAVCHIPGSCIINHQNPLIGVIPFFITSCRDIIIPSLSVYKLVRLISLPSETVRIIRLPSETVC